MNPLSCFINNHFGFWKLTFGHQVKVTQKVRKSVYFKQFFTFLERTSTFIISLIRAIYRSSYSDVFTQKSVLLQVRSIFPEEYPCGTFAWIFSCKLSIYSKNTFLEKNSGWLLLYIWKWIQHVPTSIHLFRVKIEKLQSAKLTIKALEQQN